jgi:hypothetical protein
MQSRSNDPLIEINSIVYNYWLIGFSATIEERISLRMKGIARSLMYGHLRIFDRRS